MRMTQAEKQGERIIDKVQPHILSLPGKPENSIRGNIDIKARGRIGEPIRRYAWGWTRILRDFFLFLRERR